MWCGHTTDSSLPNDSRDLFFFFLKKASFGHHHCAPAAGSKAYPYPSPPPSRKDGVSASVRGSYHDK